MATAIACTVLSTSTEALASMPLVPQTVTSLALAISPPIVATGKSVLIARPIHSALNTVPKPGVWSFGNNIRQEMAAASRQGAQTIGRVSNAQPEVASRSKISPMPCQRINRTKINRPNIRPKMGSARI